MFCTKCGKPIPEGNKFCTECGHPVAPAEKPAQAPAKTPAPVPAAAPTPAPAPAATATKPKPAAAPAPKKKKSGGGQKVALIVVVILLVAALVAAALVGYMVWSRLGEEDEGEPSRATEASDTVESAPVESDDPDEAELDDAYQAAKDANARAVRAAAVVQILTTDNLPSGAAGWVATATVDDDGEIGDLTVAATDVVIPETQPAGSSTAGSYTVFIKEDPGLVDNHHYELIVADMSWTDANDYCQSMGGHLATVTTKEEESEIIAMAEAQGVSYIWLGGRTDVDGNGNVTARWITGEDFDAGYQNWMTGEPSGMDKGDKGNNVIESYLMLWNIKGAWSWNDQRNDPLSVVNSMKGKTGFVCEYEN